MDKAHKAMLRRHHPDRNMENFAEKNEMTAKINAAKTILATQKVDLSTISFLI